MAIVFTKLSDSLLADKGKALQYVEARMRQLAFKVVPESVESLSQSFKDHAKGTVYLATVGKLPSPQLASKETVAWELSMFDQNMQKQVKAKQACCLEGEMNAKSKAGPEANEVVKEERFTYLESPFNDIPKFTTALVRKTDKAEYVLITIGTIIRPHELRKELRSKEAIFYQTPEYKVLNRSALIKGIAFDLAKGLLSGVAGKIGVLIFNQIFPPGQPSYFDEVYKQIRQIVHEEITQNTIDEIDGHVNGMKGWITITYTNFKNSGASKAELDDLLQPREPEIGIDVIGDLMHNTYAETGICVFMIAAGIHLSILQELALVDPKNSPNQSHYAKSIKDYAKKYADFANSTTDNIMNTRSSNIQPKCERYNNDYGFYNFYWFEDSLTGYKSADYTNIIDNKGQDNPEAYRQRDQAMQAYKTEKLNKLKEDMSDPKATAKEWLKLQNQPLPQA